MRKISFYPLFRTVLVQMIRHGEIDIAISRAAQELKLAREAVSGKAGRRDDGLVMVPSPLRASQLGYCAQPPVNHRSSNIEQRGRSP